MIFPRVTEVLHAFTGYDKVDKQILKAAAARGTSVHGLCAAIAKGAWIPISMVPEDQQGYVDSFRQWMDSQVEKFEIIEERYYDKELGYTGKLDFVMQGKDGRKYLVDIKTSSGHQKIYPLQIAAYRGLLKNKGIEVDEGLLVYLSREGEYPAVRAYVDSTEEYKVFTAALHCYKYFNRRKLNGNKA